jgi:hypothetical protein
MNKYKYFLSVFCMLLGFAFSSLAMADSTKTYECNTKSCDPNITYSIPKESKLHLTIICINEDYPYLHFFSAQAAPLLQCIGTASLPSYKKITCENNTSKTLTYTLISMGCRSYS